MIPSANSTGDLTWHAAAADTWADHQGAAVAGAYNNTSTSSTAEAVDHSRYLNLHRHQILDWENAMLLAHHSSTSHDSVYDQVADYTKPDGITMQADAIASLSHPRHYENLLSAHMASNPSSFSNHNAWGLLNNVCSRSSGGLQQEASLLQAANYSYESLNGADGLGGYGSLAAAGGLYNVDPLRSGSSTSHAGMLGLSSFDQRRLDDIVKRELYTTHDFNSRLGLNLGGRTYFSADDFAFGRWGKRLRPNSPGCIMQPAPLCQAEGCKADLSMAKHYHRRHKVCEYHSKAATVHIGDQTQRFCQQCSRFHVLAEFDDGKRSCRKRLADHNRRRRKPQPAPSSTVGADAPDQAKEQSQEGATGSESLQNGGKGSPLQAAEDQAMTATTSTPGISSMGNNNEASSKKGREHIESEQERVEKSEPTATPNSKVQLKLNVATNMTMASTGTSLSLGATDILDVKPAVSISHPGAECHDGGRFGITPTANKHSVMMPWLQESKNNQNLQCFPYNNITKADQNVNDRATDHPSSYEKVASSIQRPKSFSSTDPDDNGRSSWMIKGMTGSAQSEKDAILLAGIRHAKSKPVGEAGGQELLRLLGNEERELLSSNKHTAMEGNPSSIGTLAFLDHSLDPSTYTRADHHRNMLHFSSLQQAEGHHQVARSLNRPSSSNIAFGNHNHMI